MVSGSENDDVMKRVGRRFGSNMLYPLAPFLAKKIESQAILIRIEYLKQSILQSHKLRGINLAFKHRILNTNAVIETGFGDIA